MHYHPPLANQLKWKQKLTFKGKFWKYVICDQVFQKFEVPLPLPLNSGEQLSHTWLSWRGCWDLSATKKQDIARSLLGQMVRILPCKRIAVPGPNCQRTGKKERPVETCPNYRNISSAIKVRFGKENQRLTLRKRCTPSASGVQRWHTWLRTGWEAVGLFVRSEECR